MATQDITTTVQTTTSTQQGTQLTVQAQASTVSVGNFVTDVSIQPYIASRVVSFYAYGMRPNTTVHVFFDSVLVDQYCAPGIVPTSISDTSNPNSITKNGHWGDPIKTDAFGQVAGQFNIPAATFKTGDRILQIADVTSIAQGSAAISTTASATFTASNLSVTKQLTTLTTINPEVSVVPVTNTVITSNTTQSIVIHPDIGVVTGSWSEPIAQGLTINTPSGEAGIFATSIDIYFKQKSQIQQNGVTVYICQTTNGFPDTSTILPFSTVHLPWSNVAINSSGSASYSFAGPASSDTVQFPTTFTFEAPVFLNNGSEYAFVVKPDAGDPDYWVYSANLGDSDLVTGAQVVSQPVFGTAFYGATDGEWTALQTEYIKFNLRRAAFSSQSGNAVFRNTNTDFISVYNVGYACTSYGILPGDYIFQSTNSTPSTAITTINGVVNTYDSVKNIIYVDNSTGNFTSNSYMQIHRFVNNYVVSTPGPNTSTLIAYANTGKLYNPILDAFVPQFSTITPSGTTLTFNVKGISNSYSADSKYTGVTPGTETVFLDQERIIASKSNEVALNSSAKSLFVRADMTTTSELISPVIDTVRNQELVIGNNIDSISFIYNEFFNSGSSKSKYISKVVTLASGQDSEDIQIMVDAYRPPNSDIQVWVKFLNGYDSDPISQKVWTPMINVSSTLYSDPSNPNDIKEFAFSIPQFYGPIPTTGTISVSSACTVVNGVSTLFGTDVQAGWYINMLANSTFSETSRKVISIANTTQLTLDQPFNASGGYSANAYFVVAPPTTPYLSTNTQYALTGTVNTYISNNAIIGSGTNFTSLLPGQIIYVAGDEQAIVSISNNTFLTVGTPWSSTTVANTAYIVNPNGLTYLNSNYALFSTYKQFQIKVILQSNDSSKAPLLKNVRAIALQL